MSLTLRRYTIAALLISGAVLYSSWVLAFFLNSGEGPFEGSRASWRPPTSATESSTAAAICSPGSCSPSRRCWG
ncbi:hypothetical protein GS944_18570 [Rhodococcus hoagii]|nr:hypothetical protein [Prescottella equi]NKX08808.1 hypothetical protein [Prescottella equi]